jgi:hypothetical protein
VTVTQDEARARTKEVIKDAFESMDYRLVDALPTLGKSYGTIEAAAETGESISFLTARHDLYKQAEEWSRKHGIDPYILPVFHEDCPTANEDHGQEWAEMVKDLYRRGAMASEIHERKDLPCQADGECPYIRDCGYDPDEYDVLIGYWNRAYARKVTWGRNVVFDEFPGDSMITNPNWSSLAPAIASWLEDHDEVPYESRTDIIENRDSRLRREKALRYFRRYGFERPDVFEDEDALTITPYVVYTLLRGDDLGNGWERAPFPTDDMFPTSFGLFDRENEEVYIHQPPTLKYTNSIVALDGTPHLLMWNDCLQLSFNPRPVLTTEERRKYLTEVLNHSYVQLTDSFRPYTSGRYVDTVRDAAIIGAITEHHGQQPALISSKKAIRGDEDNDSVTDWYEKGGLVRFDGEDFIAEESDVSALIWRGAVLGTNEMKEERVGLVAGGVHYGDDYVKFWGALGGHSTEPIEYRENPGGPRTYTGYGKSVAQHMKQSQILQDTLRFGRDGDGATIYIDTNSYPDWLPIAGEGEVRMRRETERAVMKTLTGEAMRTSEIAVKVDVSEQWTRKLLNRLVNEGHVRREQKGRGFIWHDAGLADAPEEVEVVLPADEVAKVGPNNKVYTWDFRKNGQKLEEISEER